MLRIKQKLVKQLAGLVMCAMTAASADPLSNGSIILELQRAMAEGELTSEGLVEQAFTAMDQRQSLNAFISVDKKSALALARRADRLRQQGELTGLLHGIPVAVKDNIHVAGLPNTAGTPGLKSVVPTRDAEVIARIKAAGAIVVGKTNMHELAYGITSDNHAFGAVGNALNDTYIAGGSSGGTAVAVATGMAVAGLGTDTGGSSRIPAALNGLVGFRPTTDRYPSDGITRISHTRDTVGPMARTVKDIALLDTVLSGEQQSGQSADLAGLRLGVPRGYFYENLEPLVAQKTERLLRSLKRAGVTLIEADLEQVGELNEQVGFPIVIYETKPLLTNYIKENLPGKTLQAVLEDVASPDVKAIMAMVLKGDISELSYRKAVNEYRPQLQQVYRNYFTTHNVQAIIFPTVPLTARPIAESMTTVELNGEQVPTFATYIRNTDPASNAGIPGLSLPLPVAPGQMPVGIEIDGPEGSDRRLLAIGAAIEALITQQHDN